MGCQRFKSGLATREVSASILFLWPGKHLLHFNFGPNQQCSVITPGIAQGNSHMGCQFGYIQGKCPNHCAVDPGPEYTFQITSIV